MLAWSTTRGPQVTTRLPRCASKRRLRRNHTTALRSTAHCNTGGIYAQCTSRKSSAQTGRRCSKQHCGGANCRKRKANAAMSPVPRGVQSHPQPRSVTSSQQQTIVMARAIVHHSVERQVGTTTTRRCALTGNAVDKTHPSFLASVARPGTHTKRRTQRGRWKRQVIQSCNHAQRGAACPCTNGGDSGTNAQAITTTHLDQGRAGFGCSWSTPVACANHIIVRLHADCAA